jgi:predicted signal transduction protein with EAL and GGDEF domain
MKLSQKVPLFLAPFIILPMLGLGLFVYSKQKTEIENGLVNHSYALIEDSVSQFEKAINQSESDTTILASLSQVQRYMITIDPFSKYSLLQPQIIDFFKDFLKVHPEYAEIRIILPDGMEDTRVVSDINIRNLTDDESNSFYFKKLSLSPKYKTSIIDVNPDTKQLAVYSSVRISLNDLDDSSQNIKPSLRGYIVITKEINNIDQLISSSELESYSNFLVKKNTKIVLDNDNFIAKYEFNLLAPKLEATLLSNTKNITFDLDNLILTGRELFPDYYLFGVIPKSIILDKTRPTALLIFLITIISTGLLLIFSIWGLNSFYILPLQKLRLSVKDIRQDNLNVMIPETNRNDEIGELAESFNEMQSNLKESVDEVHRLAYVDPLTNLPNRRKFMHLVNTGIERANKNQTMLGLFYIDLDDFKIVNDTMGHDMGDTLLQQVAKRLSGIIRAEDIILTKETEHSKNLSSIKTSVYRLGGDEFTVMVNNITSHEDLTVVANRLLSSMNKPFYLNKKPIAVTISIGVALFPEHDQSPTNLIKMADIAMYHAKASGKNRFAIYNSNMKQKSEMRFHIESGIREALNQNEFNLVYQPQFDLSNNEIVGMEALLRWKKGEQYIPPNEFIPIAEESNLIIELGQWVLKRVLQDINTLNAIDIDVPKIAINVSSRELEIPAFTKTLISNLEGHDLRKGQIELELTETCIMKDIEQTITCIDELKTHGISIALDDYGTGYSSLSLLKKCNINKIKIDRSFIRDIETDENDAAIVSAIVSLGQKMGLRTIAEGIETLEQLEFLYRNGCELGQGYYFAKPLELHELPVLLKENIKVINNLTKNYIENVN